MACCQSYIPDYFAITDILTTEERISCKIEVDLPGLGNFSFIIFLLTEIYSIKLYSN